MTVMLSLLLCFGTLFCLNTLDDNSESFKIESSEVGDEFEIIVDLPNDYTKNNIYPLIIYLDAGINSGKKMPKLIKKEKEGAILIGIKHIGNYKKLRRRDFIQAHMKKGDTYYSSDKNYGQAEKFHSFLEKELIPRLEKTYSIKKNDRTLIGHSLGGLFTVYACFKEDRLFNNYIAISPSLWVNYQNIWDFERAYYKNNKSLNAKLYLAVGSYEVMNLVLYNTNIFHTHISKRGYSNFSLKKKVFKGYSHNPVVDVAVPEGIKWISQ